MQVNSQNEVFQNSYSTIGHVMRHKLKRDI